VLPTIDARQLLPPSLDYANAYAPYAGYADADFYDEYRDVDDNYGEDMERHADDHRRPHQRDIAVDHAEHYSDALDDDYAVADHHDNVPQRQRAPLLRDASWG
jgi:hypothetical protein